MTQTAPMDESPREHPPPWRRMDPVDFWRAGLLRRVNEAVLWPLGIALTFEGDIVAGEVTTVHEVFFTIVDPYEPIVSGDTPGEAEAAAERHAAWVRDRLSPPAPGWTRHGPPIDVPGDPGGKVTVRLSADRTQATVWHPSAGAGATRCLAYVEFGSDDLTHRLTSDDPLTIAPAVVCPVCGWHRTIADGRAR